MTSKTRYTKEFQTRALRLPDEPCANHASETKAVASVTSSLGIAAALERRYRGCKVVQRWLVGLDGWRLIDVR